MYFKRFGVMTRSTFKVLFYLKRQAERNGKVPVMGRITVNGTISQFSCKLSVSPKLWDTRANKATGKSVAARCINEKLENIKTNIGKQYQRICDRDAYVTAEKVRNAWMGFGDGYRLLLQTFDEYLEEFVQKRGVASFIPKARKCELSHRGNIDIPSSRRNRRPETRNAKRELPEPPDAHTTAAQNDSFARNEAETEKIVIFTPWTERSVGSYDSNFPRTWKDCSTSVISDCSSARSSQPRWSRSAPTCC